VECKKYIYSCTVLEYNSVFIFKTTLYFFQEDAYELFTALHLSAEVPFQMNIPHFKNKKR